MRGLSINTIAKENGNSSLMPQLCTLRMRDSGYWNGDYWLSLQNVITNDTSMFSIPNVNVPKLLPSVTETLLNNLSDNDDFSLTDFTPTAQDLIECQNRSAIRNRMLLQKSRCYRLNCSANARRISLEYIFGS